MPQLKMFALKKLNLIVDEFWPEISEAIEKIEILHENKGFSQRELAALVASKVYYHLGSFSDSLTYALGADSLFDVNSRSEYVDTIIAKCIDHYTELRIHNLEHPNDTEPIDDRMVAIVDRMFQRCLDEGQYRQALGIALETRRMDIFEKSIMQSDDVSGMLSYAFQVSMALLQNRGFRNTVLRSLVNLYHDLDVPDYVNMVQCLIFLDDAKAIAEILEKLSKDTEENVMMGYQLAFDIYESATQQLVNRIVQLLSAAAPVPWVTTTQPRVPPILTPSATKTEESSQSTEASTSGGEKDTTSLSETERTQQTRIENLSRILSGEVSIDLHLQFLIRSNHTDMLILKNTKDAIRVSICHTATVIANAFMHSGTTSDQFLRDNLDWLARATNWAKLVATASLGVIHRGHESQALALMSTYLPNEPGPSSGYSEGGGLYALGLIHANHGGAITDYLLQQLKDAQNEMVRHGGCLGLGLAAMGTHKSQVYDQLKLNLYQDDAVTGEAAAIAMGMVMLASKSAHAIQDMVAVSRNLL
ncbi:hypothetical protein AAG570_000018 [Ranatra chinensis]|uniref:26S proteasome non-ATPase regulatory subunit 1/RPN2 N-terminal domain-containing protein n=1 Tax=Ranatra chinensis TaxID=642074 RepID=A0ABD0YVW1_9HEMI